MRTSTVAESNVRASEADIRDGRAVLAALPRWPEPLPQRSSVLQPFRFACRIDDALARIEAAAKCTEDVLRLAPAELVGVGEFDGVVISQVRGSVWSPVAVRREPGVRAGALSGLAAGTEIPMVSGSAEAEVVRRRMPALVLPGGVTPEPAAPGQIAVAWPYVVAPVTTGDVVIGLLHAEICGTVGNTGTATVPDEVDREVLRVFADGIGLIAEILVLRQRLATQHQRFADALAAARHAVDDAVNVPWRIGAPRPAPSRRPLDAAEPATAAWATDGLTSREADVLRLLVGGASNAQIADRLILSQTTVKSHVRRILRKLHVTNRAEAVARCLATRSTVMAE